MTTPPLTKGAVILTFKQKHGQHFSYQLSLAKKVAEFAIGNRDRLSTKYIKHLGLKSAIANQILRKYGRNNKCKTIRRVPLIVPNQSIQEKEGEIIIPCLQLSLSASFLPEHTKINQIELDAEYAFVSVTVRAAKEYSPASFVGVDRNTTGHIVVAAHSETGKVLKIGKEAQHVHNKYRSVRKRLQKAGAGKALKRIKRRESNIIRNLNHHASSAIVQWAARLNAGLKLERLTHIHKRAKVAKSFRYFMHSWSYAQLEQFIAYKAKLLGVPLVWIEPAYTSQNCSRCGYLGKRKGKSFKCPHCGHADHADSNAAFNIALRDPLQVDRDACKGSTDTPQAALDVPSLICPTVRTPCVYAQEYVSP